MVRCKLCCNNLGVVSFDWVGLGGWVVCGVSLQLCDSLVDDGFGWQCDVDDDCVGGLFQCFELVVQQVWVEEVVFLCSEVVLQQIEVVFQIDEFGIVGGVVQYVVVVLFECGVGNYQ